jgi:hypothetical protein
VGRASYASAKAMQTAAVIVSGKRIRPQGFTIHEIRPQGEALLKGTQAAEPGSGTN